MNNWHCSMNFCHPASLGSEQLGWPSNLGRSEVIRLKFGDIVEHAKGYSTLFFEPIEPGLHEEKSRRNIFGMGSFGTLSLYLEMSERAGRTQGVGKCCRRGP